jgi:hypothetical protein
MSLNARLVTRAAFACTRFAFVTWLATWAAAVVTLAVRGPVAAWQGWFGVACGCAAAAAGRAKPWQRATLLALVAAFSAAALALSLLAPDLTFDANLYHFPGAFALGDGWNPIWNRADPVVAQSASINVDEIVRCYPKAGYVWFAVARGWVGNIDAGKALTFWLVVAPAGPAFAFFRIGLRQPCLLSGLAAALVCANPVALTQLTTGYNDVHVSALVSTLLFSALLATGKGWRRAGTLAGMASALLVGIKFTGLVYACVIGAVLLAHAWLRRAAPGSYFARSGLGVLLGVLLAFDSYGLNTITQGNPFFPAWQPGKITVIDSQVAPAFLQRNRIDKLVRALGARQTDAEIEHRVDPDVRFPFREVRWKPRYDARFSGFGPLFWEALWLALAAGVARRRPVSAAALAAVLASTLATEAGWWPRLAPQVWLLPILLVMHRARDPRPRPARGPGRGPGPSAGAPAEWSPPVPPPGEPEAAAPTAAGAAGRGTAPRKATSAFEAGRRTAPPAAEPRAGAAAMGRACGAAVFALLVLNVAVVARGAGREAARASDWWYLRLLRLDTSPDSSLTHEDLHRSFRRRFRDLQTANGIAPDAPLARDAGRPSWRERLALGLGLWDERRN